MIVAPPGAGNLRSFGVARPGLAKGVVVARNPTDLATTRTEFDCSIENVTYTANIFRRCLHGLWLCV
jgi:hypothetical protein